MNEPQPAPENPIAVRTPCPMKWQELNGSGPTRFCDQCSLHVHDAVQLPERTARAMIEEADGRVCMRLTYDERGRLLFADTPRPGTSHPGAPRRHPVQRHPLRRWLASAAAGLLAACQGETAPAPVDGPAPATPPENCTQVLGETSVELGDVRPPPPTTGEVEPVHVEIMGKVAPASHPTPPTAQGGATHVRD